MEENRLCQVCAEEKLGVPLIEEKGFMVCPLCQSSFPKKGNTVALS